MSNSTIETSIAASELLPKLDDLETASNWISEKLTTLDRSADQADGRLKNAELTKLRDSLKRIGGRLNVSSALAERLVPQIEIQPEAPVAEGDRRKIRHTPEDEMFPLQGCSDGATGLPTRSIAEKALEAALSHGRPRYAAAFVLDRIRHMSNRYSGDVGNQAMRHYGNFLRQRLPSDALIFRWRGAAFLAMFDISGSPTDAKLQMEQIATQKQKFSFMTNNRSAMVNLTASFLTVALAEHTNSDSVADVIDIFLEAHSQRQPS